MAQKFIITTQNYFRFGNVFLHKDLLVGSEHCLGGGFYEFDYVSNRLILSGQSYDFGCPQWHLVNPLILPKSVQGLQIEYEGCPISDLVTEVEYR